jgi:serine/threonine protein phosphatase PrpC
LSSSVLASCEAEGEFTDAIFEAALSAAYDALDAKDNGSPKKMGTTLTFLKLHKAGCTIAHIGDSRVYHLRPGADAASTEILYQTEDHSLVNDLVRIGELTPEEAKTSKQRNVITRAMQPNMERRSRADLAHSSDIRKGDYFLLCSDGILEQMEDDNLKFIFSDMGGDAQKKVDMLIKVTADNRDNHSALLVQITDVEPEAGDVPIAYEPPKNLRRKVATVEVEELQVPVTPVAESEPAHGDDSDENNGESTLASLKRYLLPTLAVIVAGLAIYFTYISFVSKDEPKAQATAKVDVKPTINKQSLQEDETPKSYKVGDRYAENGVDGLIYSINNDAGEIYIVDDVAIGAAVKWDDVNIEKPWTLASKDDIGNIISVLSEDKLSLMDSFWYFEGQNEKYVNKSGEEIALAKRERSVKECFVLKVMELKNGLPISDEGDVDEEETSTNPDETATTPQSSTTSGKDTGVKTPKEVVETKTSTTDVQKEGQSEDPQPTSAVDPASQTVSAQQVQSTNVETETATNPVGTTSDGEAKQSTPDGDTEDNA